MVRLKPACSATETCWNIEILQVVSEVIILSKNGETKVLIRLFTYYNNGVARMLKKLSTSKGDYCIKQ